MKKHGTRAERRPAVLLLTQFHAPEPCAAANRVSAMTSALQVAGFDVHVATGFASFPDGVLARGDRVAMRAVTLPSGTRLIRLATYASKKVSGRTRLLNWLSVAAASTVFALFTRRRFDVVLVTMPPITLALPALVAQVRHRAKLIVDVRDVFPDVAVKMGYWRADSPIVKIVGAVARSLYRRAALVLCVTEAARVEVIARGAAPAKVAVAANGFDPIDVAPLSPYARIPGEFVAVFVGNMGLATGLDAVIDAAERLRNEKRIRFVLAGGGVDKDRLSLRVARSGLVNVTMVGVISRSAANALIAAADVAIVPLHPGIVDSLPTKMFDALVLGCPILCCANGEAREFIERSGGGVVVAPGDGEALAAALQTLLEKPQLLAGYARAGKAFVLARYDRAKIMRETAEKIRQLT